MKPSDLLVKLRHTYLFYLTIFFVGCILIIGGIGFTIFFLIEDSFGILLFFFPLFSIFMGIQAFRALLQVEKLRLYQNQLVIKSFSQEKTIYLRDIKYFICKEEGTKSERILIFTNNLEYSIEARLVNYKKLKKIFSEKLKQDIYLEKVKPIKNERMFSILRLVAVIGFLMFIILKSVSISTSNSSETKAPKIKELKTIELTLSEELKFNNTKSPYIFSTEEYPNLNFRISDIPIDSLTEEVFFIKKGDKIKVNILEEEYYKKLAKTKKLKYSDKLIEYRIVDIYGLVKNKSTYFDIKPHEKIQKNNILMIFLFYGILISMLLLAIYALVKLLLQQKIPSFQK